MLYYIIIFFIYLRMHIYVEAERTRDREIYVLRVTLKAFTVFEV